MTLIEQLKSENADGTGDAATVFHQCVVVLFGVVTQSMLHCSGRMIPQIVKYMQPHLSADNYDLIFTCQGQSSVVWRLLGHFTLFSTS